jgi:glycosyltransferase involved in cell wall biosynthesis
LGVAVATGALIVLALAGDTARATVRHWLYDRLTRITHRGASRSKFNATTQSPLSDEAIASLRKVLTDAIARVPALPAISEAKKTDRPVLTLVTVVVPLFNEERFVADTIRSLKAQTEQKIEVIIVDDASTDNSVAVAKAAIGGDPRFKLARHLRNQGLSAARNTGLRLASGDCITFLDADDMLLPEAIKIRHLQLQKKSHETVVGTYCGVVPCDEDTTADFRPLVRAFTGRTINFLNMDGECPFNAHAPLLLTSVVRRMGGFDERLQTGCEDWDLWQRILRHGYVFEPVHRVAALYRRKRGSMVRAMPVEHFTAARRIVEWASTDLAPQEIVTGTPFVFVNGLNTYRPHTTLANRLAQFAAIAFVQPEREPFQRIIEMVPKGIWPYLGEAQQLRAASAAGLKRLLLTNNSSSAALNSEISATAALVVQHLQ